MGTINEPQIAGITQSLYKMIQEGKCKLLVTGGSGLVGSHIREVIFMRKEMEGFKDNVKFLSSKDGDLTDPTVVSRIFEDFKPTHVIHLAAMVGGLFHNMANNYDFFRNNMLINDNVLQSSIEQNAVKVVSCLSTCIFPDKTTYPIDETMIHLGPPHDSNFGYSYAKRMIDVQNRAINEKFGKKYTSVVPCNVYGPHDNYNLDKSHVIPGLIHRFYLSKQQNQQAVVKGTGTPLRQFIHARDLACLIIWALTDYDEVDPIILSVDEKDEVSIKTVAELVAKSMGIQDNLTFDTSAADGQFKKTASNDKLRKYLPNYQFIPFHAGIAESVQWFVDNFALARK